MMVLLKAMIKTSMKGALVFDLELKSLSSCLFCKDSTVVQVV